MTDEGVAPQPTPPTGIYVASRASIPARSAMWREYRAKGVPITSSWIDEAGEGETRDFRELWDRIFAEISRSERLILYVEEGDFPLKGALIEVGIALGLGKPVFIIAHGVQLEPRSFRPLGSWVKHKLVTFCKSVPEALKVSSVASAAAETRTEPASGKGWPDLTVEEVSAMFGCSVSQDRADYLNECARSSIAAELRGKGMARVNGASAAGTRTTTVKCPFCDWPTCGCDPYANKVLEAVSHLLEGAAETRQPEGEDVFDWFGEKIAASLLETAKVCNQMSEPFRSGGLQALSEFHHRITRTYLDWEDFGISPPKLAVGAETAPRWIPVSTELPKRRVEVLVTVHGWKFSNSGKSLQQSDPWVQAATLREDKVWFDDDSTFDADASGHRHCADRERRVVIAWQEMPKPYALPAPPVAPESKEKL